MNGTPPLRFRLTRVYAAVLRVLLSDSGYRLLRALRGPEWGEQHLPDYHRRNARRAKETIVAVQGLFIKVGQLVSIQSNALPADFRGELEALQDRIPLKPLTEIQARLRHELGAPAEEFFARFDETPLASASLAQVYAATTREGVRVAVKVQHWDIERTAGRDLAAIRRILGVVQLFLGMRGLLGVYTQVRAMIEGCSSPGCAPTSIQKCGRWRFSNPISSGCLWASMGTGWPSPVGWPRSGRSDTAPAAGTTTLLRTVSP